MFARTRCMHTYMCMCRCMLSGPHATMVCKFTLFLTHTNTHTHTRTQTKKTWRLSCRCSKPISHKSLSPFPLISLPLPPSSPTRTRSPSFPFYLSLSLSLLARSHMLSLSQKHTHSLMQASLLDARPVTTNMAQAAPPEPREKECVVCLQGQSASEGWAIFVPCGHLCVCTTCADQIMVNSLSLRTRSCWCVSWLRARTRMRAHACVCAHTHARTHLQMY